MGRVAQRVGGVGSAVSDAGDSRGPSALGMREEVSVRRFSEEGTASTHAGPWQALDVEVVGQGVGGPGVGAPRPPLAALLGPAVFGSPVRGSLSVHGSLHGSVHASQSGVAWGEEGARGDGASRRSASDAWHNDAGHAVGTRRPAAGASNLGAPVVQRREAGRVAQGGADTDGDDVAVSSTSQGHPSQERRYGPSDDDLWMVRGSEEGSGRQLAAEASGVAVSRAGAGAAGFGRGDPLASARGAEDSQRRDSVGLQGPQRGGPSPEPSPAYVRRNDTYERVRQFVQAKHPSPGVPAAPATPPRQSAARPTQPSTQVRLTHARPRVC